jgi:hypothetical protein
VAASESKTMTLNDIDKTGLIGESYRIDGIDLSQCRSIFLDWALKLPEGFDQSAAIRMLVEIYARKAPDHPMSLVLRDGLGSAVRTGRRGGRRARVPG